ncbi:MAG: DUF1634 domain-containing protein [Acidobacteria bacterium]|nr:DUF1634 domain-containing protein [Acidobacteriota bacterium]
MTYAFERLLGHTLGLGVAVSTALLAVGLLWSLVAPDPIADALLNVGLLVLMATPVARVVLSCAEYVRRRDWFFAASSLGVLAVLGATVWIALHG